MAGRDPNTAKQVQRLVALFKEVPPTARAEQADAYGSLLGELLRDPAEAKIQWLTHFEHLIPSEPSRAGQLPSFLPGAPLPDGVEMAGEFRQTFGANDPRFDAGPGKRGKRRPVRLFR